MKINQLYEVKALDEIPVRPQERLVIISNTTGLSFTLERIGPLAAIIITLFYLLVLYLSALSKTPKHPFASIYSDSLIETACQYLLLSVGFDTLIYRKYSDTLPILVGHHEAIFRIYSVFVLLGAFFEFQFNSFEIFKMVCTSETLRYEEPNLFGCSLDGKIHIFLFTYN
jgi:hypothetical protein